MATIKDVANYIIGQKLLDLSNMKLQKLLYYSQANFLVKNGIKSPLFEDDFEAWLYGPVNRSLWNEIKNLGSENIISKIKNKDTKDAKKLNSDEKKAVDEILNFYGNNTAIELSNQTHSESPWQDNYYLIRDESKRGEKIIPKKEIYEYYCKHGFQQIVKNLLI